MLTLPAHPQVLKEAQANTGWFESAARTVGSDGMKGDATHPTPPCPFHNTLLTRCFTGYGPLIRAYVHLILSKLRFHRNHKEFNGLFEYEEYVTLKGINDPNEGYETISDLMTLQDQIDSFQKMIFAHFTSGNNECRISALVPQVKESYGIYKFIVNMMRAIHRRKFTSLLLPLSRNELPPFSQLVSLAVDTQASTLPMLSSLCESASTVSTTNSGASTTNVPT